MPSAPYDLSISAARGGALFASPLQRSDEPSARQVRQAIATAIAGYGVRGCGEPVGDRRRMAPNRASCSPGGLPRNRPLAAITGL
jgi:hypothetical protein